jgi:hypothetical protein
MIQNPSMQREDIERFLSICRESTPALLQAAGVFVDYSEESLSHCEDFINAIYPVGHIPHPTTVLPFGYYLGETIIRNIPDSKWDVDTPAETVWDIGVKIEIPFASEDMPRTQIVRPFMRAQKFWRDRSDGLRAMYILVNQLSLGFVDPTKAKPGEWIELPVGIKFRYTIAIKEDLTE